MRVAGVVTVVLIGTTIAIATPLVATALTSAEIYPIAEQITVRIDGANTGSGVIIERQGNTYTVVTNWHVIQVKGSYTVQTADGKSYIINHNQVKRLSGVDLAVFQFSSNQNYRVAERGNSDQVTGGKTVYVAGYPDGIPGIPERTFQALPGQISGRVQKPKDGYALVYTVNAFPGMSGGPILNEEGKLVGIHGRSGTRPDTNATAVLGIPLKTYLSFVSSTPPVATIPTPRPQPTSPSRPQDRPVISRLNNFQDYFVRGKERYFNGDQLGGIEDLQQAQKLDPEAANKAGLSLAQEAAQLAQDKQYEPALPKAQIAAYLAPSNDKVWLLLGGLHLLKREFEPAIAALKKAQLINPKNADVFFAMGSANFQQKKYDEAVTNYQAGLTLKPNDPEGWFDLGNAYYVQGQFLEAIVNYNQAIAHNKKFWAAISNIGLIQYEQGNVDAAIKQWQSAISIDKQAVEPLLALAVALYTQGDRQQALALGKQALSIDKRYGDIAFLKENLWGDRLLADTKKFLQYLDTQ